MEFKLSTSGSFYGDKDKKKYEKLGFTFRKYDGTFKRQNKLWMIEGEPKIELNSIEELVDFAEGGELIISEDSIEIYDDYRE